MGLFARLLVDLAPVGQVRDLDRHVPCRAAWPSSAWGPAGRSGRWPWRSTAVRRPGPMPSAAVAAASAAALAGRAGARAAGWPHRRRRGAGRSRGKDENAWGWPPSRAAPRIVPPDDSLTLDVPVDRPGPAAPAVAGSAPVDGRVQQRHVAVRHLGRQRDDRGGTSDALLRHDRSMTRCRSALDRATTRHSRSPAPVMVWTSSTSGIAARRAPMASWPVCAISQVMNAVTG